MEEEGDVANGNSENSGNSGDNDPIGELDKTVTKSGKSSKKKSKSKKNKSKGEKCEKSENFVGQECGKKKQKEEKELSRAKIIERLEKFGLNGLIVCGELVPLETAETDSCCLETDVTDERNIQADVTVDTETNILDSECCTNIDSPNNCEDNNKDCIIENSVSHALNVESPTMGDAESKDNKHTSDKVEESCKDKSGFDLQSDNAGNVESEDKKSERKGEKLEDSGGKKKWKSISSDVENATILGSDVDNQETKETVSDNWKDGKCRIEKKSDELGAVVANQEKGLENHDSSSTDRGSNENTTKLSLEGNTNCENVKNADVNSESLKGKRKEVTVEKSNNTKEEEFSYIKEHVQNNNDNMSGYQIHHLNEAKVKDKDESEINQTHTPASDNGTNDKEIGDKDENENHGKSEEIIHKAFPETIELIGEHKRDELELTVCSSVPHKDGSQNLDVIMEKQENVGNVTEPTTSVLNDHRNNNIEETAGIIDVSEASNKECTVGVQTDEKFLGFVTGSVKCLLDKDSKGTFGEIVSDEVEDISGEDQEWDQVMGLLETSQAELEQVTARGVTRMDVGAQTDGEMEAEKLQLEKDVERLQAELANARADLQKSQSLILSQQGEHNRTMMTLKRQLYKQQVSLRKQRENSEQQLGDVMSHLLLLEGRLRKEQQCLRQEMQKKDEMINCQAKEVLTLKNQNEQLLNAIREICAQGGMNGYMRDKKRRSGSISEGMENGGKIVYDKKDKKGSNSNGKLGSVKDKLLWKNRSSLELNNFNLEKYLIRSERLCTSQEDLQNIGKDKIKGDANGNGGRMNTGVRSEPRGRCYSESVRDRLSLNSQSPRNSMSSPRNSQNFFGENDYDNLDMNKSTSESSQLSENSSGVFSMSDQDLQPQESYHGNDPYYDDDEGHFSFSSTHINMVIAEEDVMGPVVTHTGHMTSMGSMPLLSNNLDKQRSPSDKCRPHSMTSVDFDHLQQHTANLQNSPDGTTPPQSPSYSPAKTDLTPFQTFKTMFKRKGSKNKGNKKRAASLSTTTNKEYSEALKKHFQKYDMS